MLRTHSSNPISRLQRKEIGLTQGEISYLSSGPGLQIAKGCPLRGPDLARLRLI